MTEGKQKRYPAPIQWEDARIALLKDPTALPPARSVLEVWGVLYPEKKSISGTYLVTHRVSLPQHKSRSDEAWYVTQQQEALAKRVTTWLATFYAWLQEGVPSTYWNQFAQYYDRTFVDDDDTGAIQDDFIYTQEHVRALLAFLCAPICIVRITQRLLTQWDSTQYALLDTWLLYFAQEIMKHTLWTLLPAPSLFVETPTTLTTTEGWSDGELLHGNMAWFYQALQILFPQ